MESKIKEFTKNLTSAVPVLALLGLVYMLLTTSPSEIGPFGIFLFFIFLYLVWLGVFFFISYFGFPILGKFTRRDHHMSRQRSYYIASILAFAPVLLLAMQSVGRLEVGDVLLVAAFVGLATFYVVKRSI